MHICAVTAYDGTDFHGFQLQSGVATVQGALEAALTRITGLPVRIAAAGRTDAGVHASGQVISTKVAWRHSLSALQRAWNVNLPDSVTVRHVQLAPDGFHPRFSALERTYCYRVIEAVDCDSPTAARRSPLTDRFALYMTKCLQVEAMNEAASVLIGEHDFATFGQPPEGENTVRQVYQAEWQVAAQESGFLSGYPGRTLTFTIRANAFLYQMVRNVVGTLLQVGTGRWQVRDVQAALNAKRRERCAVPASPCGLVLTNVKYAASWGLQFD